MVAHDHEQDAKVEGDYTLVLEQCTGYAGCVAAVIWVKTG